MSKREYRKAERHTFLYEQEDIQDERYFIRKGKKLRVVLTAKKWSDGDPWFSYICQFKTSTMWKGFSFWCFHGLPRKEAVEKHVLKEFTEMKSIRSTLHYVPRGALDELEEIIGTHADEEEKKSPTPQYSKGTKHFYCSEKRW